MENKIIDVEQNKEHVWGSYKEVLIDDTHILRAVRIYEDAYNSLHFHDVDEVQLVESGTINYYYLDNWVLHCKQLTTGSTTFVPRWLPHRIEYVNGEFAENGVRFAQITEVAIGNNMQGNYEITRLEVAKKWKLPW